MCQPASFVLTKDAVFWSRFTDSHEEIIKESGLHADGAKGPNILRVEVVPPGYDTTRTPCLPKVNYLKMKKYIKV